MSAYKPPVLRPMNIADIIDTAVRLYRNNFAAFLGIIAVVYVPMGVFQVLLAYSMGRTAMTLPQSGSQLPVDSLLTMGLAYGGLILIAMLAAPISQGALAVAVSRRYLGYETSVADAYGTIGARWGLLIATVLLVGMAVGTGTLLCLVPGIYLAIMWALVTPVIAIEGRGVLESMKRSWDLVTNEWWRVFGTYFLLSMLVGLVAGAVSWPVSGIVVALLGPKQMALAQALSTGISTVVTIIVQPVAITGLVLMYYDLRVRKEGFDLQVLAQAMNVPADKIPTYETTVETIPVYYQTAAPASLDGFAKQARAAGMSYEQAREQLLAGGWTLAQVEYLAPAWRATEPLPLVPPQPAPAPAPAPQPDPFAPDDTAPPSPWESQ